MPVGFPLFEVALGEVDLPVEPGHRLGILPLCPAQDQTAAKIPRQPRRGMTTLFASHRFYLVLYAYYSALTRSMLDQGRNS
jgi:hypothetical protein